MCGITRSDQIQNTLIQSSLEVCEVTDKLQEPGMVYMQHVPAYYMSMSTKGE